MYLEDLKDIFAELLDVNPDKITPETNLQDDLNMDSLDAIDVIYECEEKFGMTVPDETIEKFKTVQDILTYIEENK